MQFLLTLVSSGPDGTMGELSLNGAFFCVSLEPDEDRVDHPAIPLGTYKVIVTPSLRFGRMLPLIVGVPGRSGVRVHPGNFETDTEGYILLGMERVGPVLKHSRAACEMFQSAIAPCLARDIPVTLQIVEGRTT